MAKRHNAKGRSTGEGPFWPLPYSVAQHSAFRSLSGAALKVFVELRTRYRVRGDGMTDNNGQIRLTYEEASTLLGLGKATVKRAFDELVAKGFIERTAQGQWFGRMANEWRVTDRPYKGQLATRDWIKLEGDKFRH